MATDFPISVEVDIAEPRILLDSLSVAAGGKKERQAWDESLSSGVWRDPVRRRVMLAPLPVTSSWRTTTTGSYARLAKTDYTLTTGSAWVENHRGVSGNIYLEANGTNERVTTATSYSADKPWFISVYVPGVQSMGNQTILECGWGTYGGSTTISLRFRADGQVSVYEGSTLLATSDLDYAATKTSALGNSIGLTTVNILLLPVRRRDPDGNSIGGELQIITDAMSSMVYSWEGLGSGDPIVPSGVFWWQVPIGRPSVLLAPCKFETAGTLYGPLHKLRYAPDTGEVFTGRAFYASIGASATATYSLVDSTGTAFTADGIIDSVRGKVSFSGDGTNSIAVEAVDWYKVPTTTDTDDSEKCDITEAIDSLTIQTDDSGVATIDFTARRGGLADANMEGFLYLANRPFRVYITNPDDDSEIDLMRGILHSPVWTPADGLANGTEDVLRFTGQDRSYEFERYQYGDTVSDDGKLFTDALEDILTGQGFDPTEAAISTSSLRIAQSSEIPLGEFALLPQRGDTRSQHLDTLFDKYAANWLRGWAPSAADGYIWRATDPGDLTTSPALHLFECSEDALAYGYTAAQARLRTIYAGGIVRHGIAPEANQVIVVGQNAFTGLLITSQDNDSASQDPTTAPSARPVTWAGRVHRVMELDPSVGTQDEADAIQAALFDKLSEERYLVDISCPMLILFSTGEPMWIGGVVRLHLEGDTEYEDYRILSIPKISLEAMATPAMFDAGSPVEYRATYRAEKIVDSESLPTTSDTTMITADSTYGTADAA